jgi:DNA-binding NtrC family response regulator
VRLGQLRKIIAKGTHTDTMRDWTVLLADDEYEFRSALAERLRMRDTRAFEASSGEEALRLIEADPPQVIVLDLLMPGMGGMKMLKLLGIDYSDIPVIVPTGLGITKADTELRAFECLMKPLQIEELIKTIGEALRKSQP